MRFPMLVAALKSNFEWHVYVSVRLCVLSLQFIKLAN